MEFRNRWHEETAGRISNYQGSLSKKEQKRFLPGQPEQERAEKISARPVTAGDQKVG